MINPSAIEAVFKGSLKLRPEETCLIVTDTIKEPIGRAFYDYAKKITTGADIVVMPPTIEHATEPPAEVASKMLQYDVEMLITEKSLTHTRARKAATAKGARIATMPTITEDIANRGLDIDYRALKADSNTLYEKVSKAGEIRVTTKIGTDIVFKVGESWFFGKDGGSYHLPGTFGNLPEGELSFAPETADGVFKVDASFPGLGLLDSPLTFRAKDGVVLEISGKKSEDVRKRLDRVGPKAYVVAELGIGLNPKAKIIGNILEDEKVIGTVHVALGNNTSYGRHNDVPLHLDGVIKDPDIYLDGRKIMDRGKFI